MPATYQIVQISDSHLFASKNGLHQGQNVYHNLLRVFKDIAKITDLSAIIFSGDLTQDHSDASYQLFVEAFEYAHQHFQLKLPLYWLPGNHDEMTLMSTHLKHPNIHPNKTLMLDNWQLLFIDSTCQTPSGEVSDIQLNTIKEQCLRSENNLVFMHHPPVNVGYFIDKHGLQHKNHFWHEINQITNLNAIFCGHVHRGINIDISERNIMPIYTCPATSIQFDPKAESVEALPQGPAYRVITLHSDGQHQTELNYLSFESTQ